MSSISMQISDLFIKDPIIYFSVLICNPKYFEISLGRYSTYFLKKTYNSWLDGNFCWLITSLFFNISKLSLNVIFRLCLISRFWWENDTFLFPLINQSAENVWDFVQPVFNELLNLARYLTSHQNCILFIELLLFYQV